MNLSVCILVNAWHPKLPQVIAAVESFSAEILLGVNGDFNPDLYSAQLQFKNLSIIPLEWKGYGITKNNLAQKAKNDWVLSLDSDEVLNKELQLAIRQISGHNPKHIFAFSMTHLLGNVPLHYGAWGRGKKYFYRLYNKNFSAWDDLEVHESIQKPMDAILVPLKGKVHHFTAENYAQLLQKNKHYAQLSAAKYRTQKKYIFPGRSIISSVYNFLKDYIFYLGFLDGKAGWQVAKANFYYTFLKYKL